MFHRFIKYLVSHQVIFALFLIALVWFVVEMREIFVSIFLAYIIMSSILPMVEYLRKKGLPRVFSVLIPYVIIVLAILLLIIPLIPFVVTQIQLLILNLPKFVKSSTDSFGAKIDPKQIETYVNGQLNTIGRSAVSVTTKIFGGLFSLITIFVVSLYLLMYEDSFKESFAKLFHKNSREKALNTLDQVNHKLGAWLRGQIVLSFSIGLASWIGLTILGLPYTLPLAFLAGILEVVPTIGPILSAIPAVIIALTVSPTMALAVAGMYVLIQALENHILVPQIMRHAVGLNPVVVILSIMVGGRLMGIAGAFIAIPFVSFLIVIFQSLEQE